MTDPLSPAPTDSCPPAPPIAVSAMTFWQRHGAARCARLAQDAGTSYGYWKQIANQRKRPSIELARRLVQASQGELSLDLLLFPITEQRLKGAAPLIAGNKVGSAKHLHRSPPPAEP